MHHPSHDRLPPGLQGVTRILKLGEHKNESWMSLIWSITLVLCSLWHLNTSVCGLEGLEKKKKATGHFYVSQDLSALIHLASWEVKFLKTSSYLLIQALKTTMIWMKTYTDISLCEDKNNFICIQALDND